MKVQKFIPLQEMFDRVVVHLLTQNAKSLNSSGSCMYRNDQGLKCAVGCLIPDENYTADLENKLIFDVLGPEYKGRYVNELLISLQNIHDAYEVEDWPDAIHRLAIDYNLTLPWCGPCRSIETWRKIVQYKYNNGLGAK